MITVQKAEHAVLSHTSSFGEETVSLDKATNRILSQSVSADRDFPPFNRVAMDGICIRYDDFQNGQKSFELMGIQAAGSPPLDLEAGKAIEVMTGAVLPANADTVIRYEDIDVKGQTADVGIDVIQKRQNIHGQGVDNQKGDTLIEQYTLIGAAEIGVLATVGKSQVPVLKQPRVVVISTGDELVEVDKTPLSHQIRKSNVFSLASILEKYKIQPQLVHLPDDKSKLLTRVRELLASNDVLLLSGAVSRGKFDFLPEVLEELGVQKLFHKVAQRPGKPFWFGTKDQCRVFAFPGNPIATFACATRFFEPWLKKSLQLPIERKTAILSKSISFKPSLTYYMQVITYIENGRLMAQPSQGNGSGDLANLTRVNGFLELPPESTDYKEGDVFPLWSF